MNERHKTNSYFLIYACKIFGMASSGGDRPVLCDRLPAGILRQYPPVDLYSRIIRHRSTQ
jgi:hypothetical protein